MRLRILATVALVLTAAVILPARGSTAAGGGDRTAKLVGTLPRITPTAVATWGRERIHADEVERTAHSEHTKLSGTILLLHEARQLWQFYPFDNPGWSGKLGVVVFDLDTMRPITTLEFDSILRTVQNAGGDGEWLHAIDGANRLFLREASPRMLGGRQNGFNDTIVEVDLRTFAMRRMPVPPPLTLADRRPSPEVYTLGGMTFDPGKPGHQDDSLLFFTAGPATTTSLASTGTTSLMRLPLEGGALAHRTVRACTGRPPGVGHGMHFATPLLVTEEHVFVPCQRSGDTTLIVRLSQESLFHHDGTEDVVAGPVYLETTIVDPVGRMMFVITVANEIWAFDTRAMAYVGVIGTGAAVGAYVGLGIDERTGRVFFQSDRFGFGMVEGRFFPIPQAVRTPGSQATGQERIFSDTRTGRVFVLEGSITSKPPFYKVYDTGRAPVPPPPPDPDRNTADVAEAPGRTEAKYFASGSGYGVRALVVKGLSTLPPTVSLGALNSGKLFDEYLNLDCGYTDREFVAAQVAQAEYDTGSTSASAVAATVDERTQLDFERPSRCDLHVGSRDREHFSGMFSTEPAGGSLRSVDGGPGWGYGPAACSSSVGEGEAQAGGREPEGRPSFGEAKVVCPEPGGRLEAHAETSLQGLVQVRRTWTDVRIERTDKGAESVVESVAAEISVGDLLRIGEIRAEARSRADGRPSKGPLSTHTYRMSNVYVQGERLCAEACDPRAVAEELNRSGLGRVEFRALTGRDETLLRGTPKGALTAVQKAARQRASDGALFGDSRPEVPVFEMIVYNDNVNYGRARQVYQFAGVASVANYNIVPLPSFADLLGDEDDGPDRPDGLLLDMEPSGEVTAAFGSPETAAVADVPNGLGDRIGRALQAIARGLRLILTDPKRAFLVLTAWLVLAAPFALHRRRHRLLVL